MKRTIRAEVVVPMQTFSYLPGPSLRTPGAVCSRNAPAEIHGRRDSLVEDPDLSAVPDPDDVTVDEHFVSGPQLADCLFARREV